jgi:CubicO group peptidase (beta-lactamase class C family)
MEAWLKSALNYIPQWLGFQMQLTEQPGCVVAIASKGRVVLDQAFGFANIKTKRKLTPRHRFRVASHSKTFTAAAILNLCEKNLLRLDDPAGLYVDGLHPLVAETKILHLLSHSAGLTRDGHDALYWRDRRPFLGEKELRIALRDAPIIEVGTRFKYSNHAFGLLGLIIESVTNEPYYNHVQRLIVEGSQLQETLADGPAPPNILTAQGHSSKLPLGRRVVIPGNNATNALAPATGLLSTAADLARFFATLDSNSKSSILSRASRNEMTRIHWENGSEYEKRYYGLGVMIGKTGNWDWFGHMGAFPGFLSRTVVVPGAHLSVSVLTNSVDGPSSVWSDAVLHIFQMFATRGAPSPKARKWKGRWWDLWRTVDFVPMGDHVLVTDPGIPVPFRDASEITITNRDQGTINSAPGLGSFGEEARLVRGTNGLVREAWLGGMRLSPKSGIAADLKRKYDS